MPKLSVRISERELSELLTDAKIAHTDWEQKTAPEKRVDHKWEDWYAAYIFNKKLGEDDE